ncbi:hypothetical protein IJJ36_04260 [Candidatus Saccharibacteria bacterium]|nr:hypothetical protein [Candidatus Saccharibacteria bacterium]
MEQNTTATMDSNNQKSKNNQIAMIITSIVAICGIGFGINGIIQNSQKDSQITDLKVQLEESNNKITTSIEKEKNEDKENETAANSYLSINNWGIKVKIGTDIRPLRIIYSSDEENDEYVTISVIQNNKFYEYKDTNLYPLSISIVRSATKTEIEGYTTTFKPICNIGGYNYFVTHQTGIGLFEEIPSSIMESLIEANNQLLEKLKNPNNYFAL